MIIETMDDFAAVACCCPMPVCPVPYMACESVMVPICGEALREFEGMTPEERCARYTHISVSKVCERGEESPYEFAPHIFTSKESEEAEYDITTDESGGCSYPMVTASTYTLETTDHVEYQKFDPYTAEIYYLIGDSDCSITASGTNGRLTGIETWTVKTQEDSRDPGTISGPTSSSNPYYRDPLPSWNSELDPHLSGTTYGSTVTATGQPHSSTVSSRTLSVISTPEAFDLEANGKPGGCSSIRSCDSVTASRYRWIIPSSWEGSAFHITWDTYFFPTDTAIDPSSVDLDKTYDWTGPGNPDDPDDASWKSPFYTLDPPATPGEVRIVNTRFTCYASSKFGTKPQITGEGYAPPA